MRLAAGRLAALGETLAFTEHCDALTLAGVVAFAGIAERLAAAVTFAGVEAKTFDRVVGASLRGRDSGVYDERSSSGSDNGTGFCGNFHKLSPSKDATHGDA